MMKMNIIKSIALVSVLSVAAFSSAQAYYVAGHGRTTCYYHNGQRVCGYHPNYYTNPHYYNSYQRKGCVYRGNGYYTCYHR